MMRNSNKRTFRRSLTKQSLWSKPWFYLALVLVLALLAVLIYQIPAVHDKAYYYVASARARIFYFFNPPEEEVFTPGEQGTLDAGMMQTLTAMAPTATMTPTITSTPTITPTTAFTATATVKPTNTPIPTPLPESVLLEGIAVEPQGFNNCGPANLSMALKYWGWQGDQKVTEAYLKPYIKDRNVMPYEMLGYVHDETELRGIVRYGGTLDMVKKLVAVGLPVLIERGYANSAEGWMGHYGLIIGYDDIKQEVTIPDTYLGMIKLSYDQITRDWAHFDDIYLIVYPLDREQEVIDILGPHIDEAYNKQYALDQVTNRLYNLKGQDLFFAWFSRGSIQVEMDDYFGASQSYDEAFKIYETLETKDRPWRILWYQTGPYFSYYWTGRYHDLRNLAQQTLDITPEDAIPETWVWKGRAEVMMGLRDEAIESFKQALVWHPGWWVAENELTALGVTPP